MPKSNGVSAFESRNTVGFGHMKNTYNFYNRFRNRNSVKAVGGPRSLYFTLWTGYGLLTCTFRIISLNKKTCQQGPKKKVNEQKQINLNDAHTELKDCSTLGSHDNTEDLNSRSNREKNLAVKCVCNKIGEKKLQFPAR